MDDYVHLLLPDMKPGIIYYDFMICYHLVFDTSKVSVPVDPISVLDLFGAGAYILITPCAKKVVWLHETTYNATTITQVTLTIQSFRERLVKTV